MGKKCSMQWSVQEFARKGQNSITLRKYYAFLCSTGEGCVPEMHENMHSHNKIIPEI